MENEEMNVERIVKERIKENENLFEEEELKIVNDNIKITKKIYLLGLINARQIYN